MALLPAIGVSIGWTLWAAFALVSTFAFVADLVMIPRGQVVAVDAVAPAMIYIGEPARIEVTFRGPARWHLNARWEVGDNAVQPRDMRIALDEAGERHLRFDLVAKTRGTAEIIAIWLRWEGPLGLARRTARRDLGAEVPVVPNVRAVRALALQLLNRRELMVGVKSQKFVGDGSEFQSLRKFMPGYDHRNIDWKASARHKTLLCRETRAERNHAVVMAFDTGYLMRQALDGVPRLDHAINAGLLLSYVCLKSGDRVGMYSFADSPGTFLKPVGGVASVARLQRNAADLEYRLAETNFTYGMTDLSTRLSRRSLIIVFTDFVDTVSAELMADNMKRLSKRHLVLFVSLRDPMPDRLTGLVPRDMEGLHRTVIADEYLQERRLVMQRLRRYGVHCIDASPHEVSAELINRYLDIQRRELV